MLNERRFIGCDVNPAALKLTRLLMSPPTEASLRTSFLAVSERCKREILNSYRLSATGSMATHYLWEKERLSKVWTTNNGNKRRVELEPTDRDLTLASSFDSYTSGIFSTPRFFNNARINAASDLHVRDFFTGRALHNIDLLIEAINLLPDEAREPLLLC